MPLTLLWRLARSIAERISRSLRSWFLSIQAPTVTLQPEFRRDARHELDAAGRGIGADRAGQRSQQLEVGADLLRRGRAAGVRMRRTFERARRKRWPAGRRNRARARCRAVNAQKPACTHATRAITAATVRILLKTKWGRMADPRTRPLGSAETPSARMQRSAASGGYSSNYATWQILGTRMAPE